jgi:XTP/dITP diphosphohydrolase
MNRRRITIASRNPGKTHEFRDLLGSEFEVCDLCNQEKLPPVEETGETFEENAIVKAIAAAHHCAGWILGDDSGLEVDLLGGAPGIYSARYAGAGATDRDNIAKLSDELANCCHEQRTARFRCVLALAEGRNMLATFTGTVEGRIIDQPRGAGGFGYDPVFVPAGFDQTFAELPVAVKNTISHRAVACQALRAHLASLSG